MTKLYDSYFRALRWASDRIGERGIIAFVSNNSFLDANSTDGVRLSLAQEFSQIFVYNLRGGIRGKLGESAKREGGNIFPIMTGVAITVLVKDPTHSGTAEIFYTESEDYTTRQEKLDQISSFGSIEGISGADAFHPITPNRHGDWISSRDELFATFQEVGNKSLKGKESSPAIFRQFSLGLGTNRDAWCYNFSHPIVQSNMKRMIKFYNDQVESHQTSTTASRDSTKINWNRQLLRDLDNERRHSFKKSALHTGTYRPFCTQVVYFAREMNNMVYQLPQLFPTQAQRNLCLTVTSEGSAKEFASLTTTSLPDLHLLGAGVGTQTFPLYTWEPLSPTSGSEPDLFADLTTASESQTGEEATASSLDFSRPIGDQIPVILDGYRRVDNVTDATLASYREHYGDAGITKEDIFFYVYALLHHPEYRERYEDDLKKMLPHIPRAAGFHTYASVGRELADLHVNYERVEPYPSVQEEASLHAPADPWERYRIGERKMRFPKLGRRDKDFTRLEYNDYVTLTGIPAQAQGYSISGRSPLEWIIDRYHVKTDKASGIVNDPNDFLREQGRPDTVVDLIKRLVTVSMRTQELLATLPPLEIPEVQN